MTTITVTPQGRPSSYSVFYSGGTQMTPWPEAAGGFRRGETSVQVLTAEGGAAMAPCVPGRGDATGRICRPHRPPGTAVPFAAVTREAVVASCSDRPGGDLTHPFRILQTFQYLEARFLCPLLAV